MMSNLLPPRAALALAIVLAALSTPARAAQPAAGEEKVLNVYNWSDYIGEDTIRGFERETGIQVHYDAFDSNELLHAKLTAGRTGYDIVVPSSYWARMQIQGGLYRKLDKAAIPNLANLDPAITSQLAKIDPGNDYLVDWLWGYTTVGINVAKVKRALGTTPMPDDAWDLVFKPELVAKMKSCGVSFLDSGDEVVPAVMHYLRKPRGTTDKADYAQALDVLRAVRPSVTLFSSSGYIDDLANGALCLVLGWSGDINIARQRAIDNRTGQDIEVLVPRSGGLLFFDTMAIPKDAPHPGNAAKWINYILRPDVEAGLTRKVFYANPVPASRRQLDARLADNPTLFPGPDVMSRMVGPPDNWTNDLRRMQNRTFTTFKTGN
jgi:putrescine transport system substrate-binding protein